MEEEKNMDISSPLVSIYCLTYNHEKYIRDCLDGFLMQRTDFPFEVIVHDDASTDSTQAIIREYAKKYPDIIIPIYQTVNQFQQHVPIIKQFILPKVHGKYVAICEGDDYWTDSNKLQSQVSLLENHPECHFCVCGVQEVMLNKTPFGAFHPSVEIDKEIIDSDYFIQLTSTYSFQTSSYLMRFDDWKIYMEDPPEFKTVSDIGDLPMLLYFGSMGKIAYVNKVMSCYRRGAPNSYSTKKNQWTVEHRISHYQKQINVWKLFDNYSQQRFHEICMPKIAQNMFGMYILQGNVTEILKKENQDYFHSYSISKKLYLIFACVFKKTIRNHYMSSMKKREEKEQQLWESK